MSNRLTAILEASLRATAYVMGGEITYSDGEDSATFDATFGRSAFEVSDGSVARIEYNDHDYIHQRTLKSLTKILKPGDVTLHINGDPRGYALKVDDKWVCGNNAVLKRDWGGYGILAPEFTGE